VPAADQHVSPAAHPGMNGRLGQARAINVVLWGSGNTTDQIAGIDVLQVDLHPPSFEKLINLFLKEETDISGAIVA
jgi:hypothetical protein